MCLSGQPALKVRLGWKFPKSEAKAPDISNLTFLAPISA